IVTVKRGVILHVHKKSLVLFLAGCLMLAASAGCLAQPSVPAPALIIDPTVAPLVLAFMETDTPTPVPSATPTATIVPPTATQTAIPPTVTFTATPLPPTLSPTATRRPPTITP